MFAGKRAVWGTRSVMMTLVGSLLGLGVGPARAELITWEFAGEIESVLDPDDALGGAITRGTPFSGVFTFESTTPDSSPDPRFGTYEGALISLAGQLGGMGFGSVTPADEDIVVWNGVDGYDSFSFRVGPGSLEPDFFPVPHLFSLDLVDSTETTFAIDALPVFPPDLALFDLRSFGMGSAEASLRVEGTVTTLIPEPATLGLLAVPAALCVAVRRRKKLGRGHRILFTAALFVAAASAARGEWTGGPILIGGDDIDQASGVLPEHNHFVRGGSYMREAFNFLGAHVTNGNSLVVCIGCNGGDAYRPIHLSSARTREILPNTPTAGWHTAWWCCML